MDIIQLDASASITSINQSVSEFQERISYVTVNSADRQALPSTITDVAFYVCPTDPLSVTQDSDLLTLSLPQDCSFQIGDLITLDNVHMETFTLTGYGLFLGKTITIYCDTSGTFLSRYKTGDVVDIEILQTALSNKQISSSLLNGISQIVIGGLARYQDSATLYNTFILPVTHSTETTTSFDISITVQSRAFGGIPLQQIQANTPLDGDHAQAFQRVLDVDSASNKIVIKCGSRAFYNITAGGDKVTVSRVLSYIQGYDTPSQYYIPFPRTFTQVTELKVESSLFPLTIVNSIPNPTTTTTTQWSYEGDTPPFDTVSEMYLPKGCYTYPEMLTQIIRLINYQEVPVLQGDIVRQRVFRTNPTRVPLQFECRCLVLVPSSIFTLNTLVDKVEFTITSHGLRVGDMIRVCTNSTSKTYADILSGDVDIIDDCFTPVISVASTDAFTIRVNTRQANVLSKNTKIDLDMPSRIKLGGYLPEKMGFAINTFDYKYLSPTTPSPWPFPSFEIRCRPDQPLNALTPSSTVSDITLTRVRLDPNKIRGALIDKHTNEVTLFPQPLQTMSGINITIVYPDGDTTPDFNNVDHTLTLRIKERVPVFRAGTGQI